MLSAGVALLPSPLGFLGIHLFEKSGYQLRLLISSAKQSIPQALLPAKHGVEQLCLACSVSTTLPCRGIQLVDLLQNSPHGHDSRAAPVEERSVFSKQRFHSCERSGFLSSGKNWVQQLKAELRSAGWRPPFNGASTFLLNPVWYWLARTGCTKNFFAVLRMLKSSVLRIRLALSVARSGYISLYRR